jgi:hypothetical protein
MVNERQKQALQNIYNWAKESEAVDQNTVTVGERVFGMLFDTDEKAQNTEGLINFLRDKAIAKGGVMKIKRPELVRLFRKIDSSIDIPRPYNPKKNDDGKVDKEERAKALPNESAVNCVRGTWHKFYPDDKIGKNTQNDYVRIEVVA